MPAETGRDRGGQRHAIVVFHGIGEQQPGSTVRLLLGGLCSKAGLSDITGGPERVAYGEPIPPLPLRVRFQGTEADLYEVYWSPKASHKTTARSVISWLLHVTFVPGSRFGGKPKVRPWPKRLYDRFFIGGIGVAALFLILLALASLTSITAQAECASGTNTAICQAESQSFAEEEPKLWDASRPREVAEILGASTADLVSVGNLSLGELNPSRALQAVEGFQLWQALVLFAIIWFAAQFVYGILEGLRVRGLAWKLVAISPVIIVLAVTVLFSQLLHLGGGYPLAIGLTLGALIASSFTVSGTNISPASPRVDALRGWTRFLFDFLVLLVLIPFVPALLVAFALVIVVVFALLRTGASFLAESIGDIQVYTTRDPNNPLFSVRQAVLDSSEEVFGTIASRESEYDSIILIGHSLGAVVLFDTLPVLASRMPDLLDRVNAVVTLGSAVEKVRYFFSKQSAKPGPAPDPGDSFNARSSALRESELVAATTLAKSVPWINLWYANDPVADAMTTFARPNRRFHLGSYSFLPKHTPPSNQELIETALQGPIVNGGLGWRWKQRLFWPHSDYWQDPNVLAIIRDVVFR